MRVYLCQVCSEALVFVFVSICFLKSAWLVILESHSDTQLHYNVLPVSKWVSQQLDKRQNLIILFDLYWINVYTNNPTIHVNIMINRLQEILTSNMSLDCD